MTDRKRRSDSWDAPLTDEQRGQVFDLMRSMPWYQVAEQVEEKFGIPAPGKTALYEFQGWMRERESERRIAEALAFQAQTRRAVEQIGDMDAEMAAGWEQLALEASLSGNVEIAEKYLRLAETLRDRALERAKLDLRKEAQEKAWEELKLAREKWEDQQARNAQAKEALEGVKAKGGIDEETLQRIEEAVNLL